MSESWKLKREMLISDLPGLLRRLADVLEGRPDRELAGMSRDDWRKLVLVAERSGSEGGEGLELKLKVKRAGEVLVPAKKKAPQAAESAKKESAKVDPAKKEKYRQLKKRMQADAKVLDRAVRAGILPTEETLESFLSLAEIMVEMDSKAHDDAEMKSAGAAFLADALLLREAFHRHDVEALTEILGRLDRRRSACHAQFK